MKAGRTPGHWVSSLAEGHGLLCLVAVKYFSIYSTGKETIFSEYCAADRPR